MSQVISIGLLHNNLSGWAQRLFIQSGLCLIPINKKDDNVLYPALYYSKEENSLDQILDKTNGIKLVITTHDSLASILNIQFACHFAKSFSFDSEKININQEIFAISNLEKAEQVGEHFDPDGQQIFGSGILKSDYKGVQIISFPWNLQKELEMDEKINTKKEFIVNQGFSFVETGTATDYRQIRQLILFLIKNSFSELALPFCFVDFKPKDNQYLCVRLDADGFSDQSTDACLKIAQFLDISFTWFLNLNDLRKNKAQLIKLKSAGQDIQIHGYFHMVFNSLMSNLLNNGLAKFVLLSNGLKVSGSSSPLGLWNKNYFKSLNIIGVKYSSEFAIGIDDIPFTPFNLRNSCVQIPSFNLSIGVAGFNNSKDLIELWRQSILEQIDDKGVAIMYDHPHERLETIIPEFQDLLLDLKDGGIKIITLTEYFELWNKRPVLSSIKLYGEEVKYEFEESYMNEEVFNLQICPPDKSKNSNNQALEKPAKINKFSEIHVRQDEYADLQKYSFFRFLLIEIRNIIRFRF